MPLFLLSALVLMAADEPLQPGDHERSLEIGGRTRKYVVYVPKNYNGKTPLPLVLAFHGGGSNAWQMVTFCGLNEKADAAGFLVVYPNGTGTLERAATFNAGNCCGYAQRNDVDDVAFVRIVLDDLAKVARVDPRRVFATGMSNGGMICYRLADELSDRIAAIAPVGGPMGKETCTPKRPVSVIHFHGTADDFAPYAGGVGKRSLTRTNFYSVEHSIRAWVKANGCGEKPVTRELPNKADDGLTVTRAEYPAGREGAEVVLITIQNGGHTWPGREPPLAFLGKSTRDVSANDLMWEFFQKHARKDK